MLFSSSRRSSIRRQSVVLIESLEHRVVLSGTAATAMSLAGPAAVPLTATTHNPSVTIVSPASGATGVSLDSPVTADLNLPNGALNAATVNSTNVTLLPTSGGAPVPAVVNTTGGKDAIILTPSAALLPNTSYTFAVSSGVKDITGAPMTAFSSTFTTGTSGPPELQGISFTQVALPTTQQAPFTCVRIGPDHLLYASTEDGRIFRFPMNADGTLGTPQIITSLQQAEGGNRLITGFTFDKTSTASNVTLWVSNSFYALSGATNGQDLTGRVTVMSGPDLGTVRDAVINLPRSVADHSTEQPTWGPDGALYWCQPSNSAYGAPDQTWGNRPEHLLSAAILRLDTTKLNLSTGPLNALTPDVGGSYNPYAAGAPLTIYATGVRNTFELFWDPTGTLWAANNGSSAGGNAPAFNSSDPNQINGRRIDTGQPYAGANVSALTNIQQAEDDYLYRIVKGGYYGHPNPTRGEYVLDGGNPASGGVPDLVFSEYPIGTNPDPNYRASDIYDLGPHHSPDGVIQYQGSAFNGALSGKFLIAEESAGDDIAVVTIDSSGNVSSIVRSVPGFSGFTNPVNLIEDPSTGYIYVSELGAQKITLLKPNWTALTPAQQVAADQAALKSDQMLRTQDLRTQRQLVQSNAKAYAAAVRALHQGQALARKTHSSIDPALQATADNALATLKSSRSTLAQMQKTDFTGIVAARKKLTADQIILRKSRHKAG
ncbi:MAG TPA: Ig-like domain-containing protein [Tepidisphaeraceae bacterium]|nr:Ig-like domain-containing protein [Tepidisphaeraceae bacterium]